MNSLYGKILLVVCGVVLAFGCCFAADDDVLPTIFHEIKSGNMEKVRAILSSGGNVNQETGYFGETPLMYAAERSGPEMVEFLISRGANVRKATPSGTTALHKAAFWGRLQNCEILLKHGADVNAKAGDGTTPLHEAVMGSPDYKNAKRENLGVCELLVKHGADINAKRAQGKTALAMALIQSKHQRKQIAEYLQRLNAAN